jgi:putative ABC transport system permease protein
LTRETFSFHNPENDARFDESNVMAVDTTFFDVFTFPLVKGNPKTVLKNPDGILISASMAKKYFGDQEPIGKHLAVNDEERLIEVVGVFQDVPAESYFHFDFLVSYIREKGFEDPESQFYTWRDFGHYNYIRLQPGTNANQLEFKLGNWIRKYIDIPEDVYRSSVLPGLASLSRWSVHITSLSYSDLNDLIGLAIDALKDRKPTVNIAIRNVMNNPVRKIVGPSAIL